MVALPWVEIGDPWFSFLDVPMGLVLEHPPEDIVAKLLNLFMDVEVEGIT